MPNYFIKLSGKFNINEPLVRGEDYILGLEVNAKTKEEDDAEQTGELDITYKCPVIRGEIVSKLGKKIKIEDKGKQSAKLRQQLVFIAQERGLEPQQFYDATMVKFRHYTMEILDLLEGLEK